MLCDNSVSEQYVSIAPYTSQDSYLKIMRKLQSEAAYLVLESHSVGMIGDPELRLKSKIMRSAEWEDSLNKWVECRSWGILILEEEIIPEAMFSSHVLLQYSFYNKEGELLLQIQPNSTQWGYSKWGCLRHITDDITQWESVGKARQRMHDTHLDS